MGHKQGIPSGVNESFLTCVPISILWFLPVKILHVFLIKSKVMMVCLHN